MQALVVESFLVYTAIGFASFSNECFVVQLYTTVFML